MVLLWHQLLGVVVVVCVCVTLAATRRDDRSFQEDFATTPDLILKHGYPVEVHTVYSEDGYMLTLHRIPYAGRERRPPGGTDPPHSEPPNALRVERSQHSKREYHKRRAKYQQGGESPGRPVVFLQHGVFASSLDWVLTGPGKALGYSLADAGYDVWLGNLRGNIYSSEHVNMSRNDANFWNFSWHEIGMYDLPAMIDYVLVVTGHPTLQFVGHSMGATTAVVMLSEKPQYNSKLDFTVLLAPVIKLQHNTSILRYSARFWKAFQRLTGYSGLYGFPPRPQSLQRNLQPVCEDRYIGSGLCAKILHTVAGYAKQLNQTLLPTLFGHYPTQTSIKTMSHFMQGMHTGNFTKYDHGVEENMARYNQTRPPEYDLDKITTRTVIFYGDNDPFTDFKDLSWLALKLPNIMGSYRVPSESFSHLSFLWSTDVDTVLYAPLVHLLTQLMRH